MHLMKQCCLSTCWPRWNKWPCTRKELFPTKSEVGATLAASSAGEEHGRAGKTKGKWRCLQDLQEGIKLSPKSQFLLAVLPSARYGEFCESKPWGVQALYAHHFMKMHPRKDWTSHSAEEWPHCNNYQIPINSVFKTDYFSNIVTYM